MKTVIILISSGPQYLQHLSLATLKKETCCKIIAIANQELKPSLPDNFKKSCDQINFIDTDKSSKFIMPLNHNATFKIVEQEYKNNKEILIYTVNESNILLLAQLRDEFNLQGMGYKKALIFRDKLLMKKTLSESDIRVPYHCKLNLQKAENNTKRYFSEMKEILGLPFIAKPTDMAGGIGVIKVNSEIDFKNYIALAKLYGDYEAEEYIEGELYHCDTILHEGKIIWSECCKYNLPLMNISSLKCVGSIPLFNESALRKRIINFSLKTLEALEYQTGISHLEVFLSNKNELVFLEVTARPGGSLIMPMYKKIFNIDLPFTDLLSQMGASFETSNKISSYAFWLAFPCLDGSVHSFNIPKIKSHFDINWEVQLGDMTKRSLDMIDVSGTILAWNDNYSELMADFNNMADFIPYETTQ